MSQAASDLNLTVVVDEDQADRLVRLLHAQLIAQAGSPEVFGPSWEQLQPEKAASRSARSAGGSGSATRCSRPWATTWRPTCTISRRSTSGVRSLRSIGAVDRVLYSMKANSNPEILERVRAAGAAFECVSPGEIERVLECFPGHRPLRDPLHAQLRPEGRVPPRARAGRAHDSGLHLPAPRAGRTCSGAPSCSCESTRESGAGITTRCEPAERRRSSASRCSSSRRRRSSRPERALASWASTRTPAAAS